ncbi:MAG: hypothetical protein QNK37_33920 [Acidobacteriota bacterium]|nr:hypothetical protein [Acidobacteriota bacterium]
MELGIELYPGGELKRSHTIPLIDIVRPVVKQFLAYPLPGMRFLLYLAPVPQYEDPAASVVNMAPDYGYAVVFIFDQHMRLHYRHPHPLTELVAEPLARRLRHDYPEEDRWGYRLCGPELPDLPLEKPTPPVEGADWTRKNARAKFRIRRLEEAPPPPATPAEFGVTNHPHGNGPVTVLVPQSLHDYLLRGMPLSTEVEEGGFLTGRIYRNGDSPGRWLAEITGVPKAQHTGASLLHFTFTGDSFAAVKRGLPADRTAERLLGWYHTHLFPAREEMGLSSIDLELHFTTFRQPWQLAGLINLEDNGRRVLRFYVRHNRTMIRCPHCPIAGGAGARDEVTP